MAAFETAWNAWLDDHRSNGFAIDAFLRPAADDVEIEALEREIGFALPPDLVSLWRCADGQIDPVTIEDPAPGSIVLPFFGRYDWCGIDVARDGGGNAYAVDLSPAPGGTYGQVILHEPDEDERRVLAPGIAAFMADAAARRPPLDHSEGESPWICFEMEPLATSGS